MTANVKNMAPRIWSAINAANRVLLHCHRNPDPDSVGSALSLYHCLSRLGKSAYVLGGDSPLSPSLSILPGFEHVSPVQWTGITVSDFDLFLVCDTAHPSQITNQVDIQFPLSIPSVVINHHVTNSGFADINLIDPSYPATCQILANLFVQWDQPLTPEIAACLLIGIYSDTGGFKYPPTSAATFSVASKLAAVCPDYHSFIFDFENSNSPQFLRFMSLAFSNISLHFSNQVAVSAVSYHDLLVSGLADCQQLDKSLIANFLVSVKGWLIGVALTEKAPGYVELSFRTRDPENFPVSNLALALGGGGHPAAAGAKLKSDSASAMPLLLSEIQRVFPSLGS